MRLSQEGLCPRGSRLEEMKTLTVRQAPTRS